MNVQGNSLGAVQWAVCREMGYSAGSKQGKRAKEATKYALQYLNQPHVTFAANENGLTYEEQLRKETTKHVKAKMCGSGLVTSFILSLILSSLISAVVKLVVSWWILETVT